ncbi:MAG: RidA family protein, partial [Elusimicrobiota bacterium]
LPPHAQARSMFARALEAARAHGFPYRDAVRTWIYLRRILDWYGEVNQARNALYARPEFLGGEASLFPASTGIQGRAGEEECLMDALFFSSAGAAAARRVQKTARQEASCAYGSAFSRGACLELDGRRLVHVSGTASIGSDGESLHRGDAAAQSRETLDAVSAVLGTEGAGLGDIAMSTLFCKDRAAYEAWRTMIASAGRPEFPMIAVLADVCRPELLVELEALAVV